MPGDTNEDQFRLQQECRTFTRYLMHREPDSYVLRKYLECHAAVFQDASIVVPIDNALLRFARKGRFWTRIADAYARIFRPRGTLRRKLILIFAILENSRAYHCEFTSGGSVSGWAAYLRVASAIAGFLMALSVGMVVFLPRHFLTLRGGKGRQE